jgi:hypothetical protein
LPANIAGAGAASRWPGQGTGRFGWDQGLSDNYLFIIYFRSGTQGIKLNFYHVLDPGKFSDIPCRYLFFFFVFPFA